MNKAEIKHIKEIASKLPVMYTTENQKSLKQVTGENLIKSGITKLKTGEAVNPNELYLYPVGEGVRVNHFKRIKKLCEQGRHDAAQRYINEVAESTTSKHIDLLKSMEARKLRI